MPHIAVGRIVVGRIVAGIRFEGAVCINWTNFHRTMLAAVWGDVQAMRAILANYPCAASSASDTGLTPLHRAAQFDETAVVELLLEVAPHTASTIDSCGNTPLHYAAERRNIASMELLCRAAPGGASLAQRIGWTPQDLACVDSLGHVMARHVRLSRHQWACVQAPQHELDALFPVVLARSFMEATWLFPKLSASIKARVRTVLLCAHRLGLPRGLETRWLGPPM